LATIVQQITDAMRDVALKWSETLNISLLQATLNKVWDLTLYDITCYRMGSTLPPATTPNRRHESILEYDKERTRPRGEANHHQITQQ
jgi:hypothetical protein